MFLFVVIILFSSQEQRIMEYLYGGVVISRAIQRNVIKVHLGNYYPTQR